MGERQLAFRQAVRTFNDRLGVDHTELSKNVDSQKIARSNLDKETLRLREKFGIQAEGHQSTESAQAQAGSRIGGSYE